MEQKICKFCKKTIKYNNWKKYASNCGNCKQNPNYKLKIEKQRQTVLNKRNNYKFICKCKTKYILNLTPTQYKNKRYRTHC